MSASSDGDSLPPTLQQGVDDPTQTTALRREWTQAYNERWQTVKQELRAALQSGQFRPQQQPGTAQQFPIAAAGAVGGAAYLFAQFAQWLRDLLETTILSALVLTAVIAGRHWTGRFLRRVTEHALRMADEDLIEAGFDAPSPPPEAAIHTQPYSDALSDAYLDAYLDTEAVIEAVHTAVTRAMRERLREEGGVLDELIDEVESVGENRTAAIASTRIVALVNRMIILRYADAGVEEVGIVPEAKFQTAEDRHVCNECKGYARRGPYTIEEILSGEAPLIPEDTHPFCRCRYVLM